MTNKQLIAKLSKLDPNLIVVMASDSEGNGFSPLSSLDTGCSYKDGEVGLKELTPQDVKNGYSEEDVLKGKPAVVLYPA